MQSPRGWGKSDVFVGKSKEAGILGMEQKRERVIGRDSTGVMNTRP